MAKSLFKDLKIWGRSITCEKETFIPLLAVDGHLVVCGLAVFARARLFSLLATAIAVTDASTKGLGAYEAHLSQDTVRNIVCKSCLVTSGDTLLLDNESHP